jgi:hypothetical protein
LAFSRLVVSLAPQVRRFVRVVCRRLLAVKRNAIPSFNSLSWSHTEELATSNRSTPIEDVWCHVTNVAGDELFVPAKS